MKKMEKIKPKRWIIIGLAIYLIALSVGGYFIYQHYKANPKIKKLGFSGLPGQLFGPRSTQKAAELSPDKIIEWTNYYRAQDGLKPLSKNNLLTQAAQSKVDDMFKNQYFEHVSPTGLTPSQRVSLAGYEYTVTGENLALGDFKDEKDLVDAWMNSPGHRANILNQDYTEIGVASVLDTFEDRSKTWLAVQEFGRPLPNCSKPDENMLNDINSKKSQYESLVSQINSLNAEASNLNSQANAKIQQGNDVYASTHDVSQAQPYWDEGNSLRNQANADIAQAKNLQSQAEGLNSEIKTESDQYNSQVNSYNSCIAG